MLNCYRLARFYHQSPGQFLCKSLSEIARDVFWTGRLIEHMNRTRDG